MAAGVAKIESLRLFCSMNGSRWTNPLIVSKTGATERFGVPGGVMYWLLGRPSFVSWKLWAARPICFRLFEHFIRLAASRIFWTAGRRSPIRIAMIAITTRSSMSVKADLRTEYGISPDSYNVVDRDNGPATPVSGPGFHGATRPTRSDARLVVSQGRGSGRT